MQQPPLSSVTYIAIHGKSPGEHEGRVAFPGCFEAQHETELLSGLPKDCLRGSISTTSNTAQLKTEQELDGTVAYASQYQQPTMSDPEVSCSIHFKCWKWFLQNTCINEE
jgi:hypothetical protein